MEYYLGQIVLFPYQFVPQGWMACTGQSLKISQYTALYSLLGTRFGGDGINDFHLPDLQKREPAPGLTYCIAIEGAYYPARA